jgi:hypothetical protein
MKTEKIKYKLALRILKILYSIVVKKIVVSLQQLKTKIFYLLIKINKVVLKNNYFIR